jgi:hypothetical protein
MRLQGGVLAVESLMCSHWRVLAPKMCTGWYCAHVCKVTVWAGVCVCVKANEMPSAARIGRTKTRAGNVRTPVREPGILGFILVVRTVVWLVRSRVFDYEARSMSSTTTTLGAGLQTVRNVTAMLSCVLAPEGSLVCKRVCGWWCCSSWRKEKPWP